MMELHYWKVFCFITYCTAILAPVSLMGMMDDNNDQRTNPGTAMELDEILTEEEQTLQSNEKSTMDYTESSGEYEVSMEPEPFTTENTKVSIITGESIGKFIQNNTKIPTQNWNWESLEDLIETSGLEYAEDLSAQNTQAILDGINILSRDLKKFGIYRVDLEKPNAFALYKTALGNILKQYFEHQERRYGFNIIALLRNETELWLGEIPSKEKMSSPKRGGDHPLNEKLMATKKEVDTAFAIFEPLLDKLFIEGKSEATQERRKTCWLCTKDCVLVIVICYFILGSLIGLGSGALLAIVNVPGIKCP